MSDFEDAVIAVIAGLGPGDVVTYGEVAAEAGYPGAARAVGTVLGKSEGLPWWRVVGSGGRIRTSVEDGQAGRLADEGVLIVNGRVATLGE
ncbi:MAG TPA: MGMT family protein [Acidimicrobiia bacterium]|nr:MGMT family protein [Acidimicrobiia bacterium]